MTFHPLNCTLRALATVGFLFCFAISGEAKPLLQYDFANPGKLDAFRSNAWKSCEIIPATNPLHSAPLALTNSCVGDKRHRG